MATETHHITCARAHPDQVQRVREWFQKLKEELANPHKGSDDVGCWMRGTYYKIANDWERILFGEETDD